MKTTHTSRRERLGCLASFLLLDILVDPHARPVFIWAGITVIFGATIFHWLEQWSWLDAIYFTVVSLTTVGYGDFAPTRPITKIFAIFFILNGYAILLSLIDVIRDVRARRR